MTESLRGQVMMVEALLVTLAIFAVTKPVETTNAAIRGLKLLIERHASRPLARTSSSKAPEGGIRRPREIMPGAGRLDGD
jgi:hypothetical protein